MCKKILIFISKLYPFNDKISKEKFLKWNFIATIVYGLLFLSNQVASRTMIFIIYVFFLIFSPIGIYQYLKNENFLGNIFLCIGQVFLILLIILSFNPRELFP
jgi:uncharacterized membrane protein HdeD (DUF308 family)